MSDDKRGPMETWIEGWLNGEPPCQSYEFIGGKAVSALENFARQQDAQLAAALSALEPFGLLMAHVKRQTTDFDNAPIWATSEITITQGHVRAVAAVLDAAAKAGSGHKHPGPPDSAPDYMDHHYHDEQGHARFTIAQYAPAYAFKGNPWELHTHAAAKAVPS